MRLSRWKDVNINIQSYLTMEENRKKYLMNRTVSMNSFDDLQNEIIVPTNPDLSWSQKSASLQTSATRSSIVTKQKYHATCKGWHFRNLHDRITS